MTRNSFTFSYPGSFSCKSSSIIYLITCSCGIQYVGLTEQCLNERMNGHRASIKAGKSSFLYDHFNLDGHSFSEASVQIIDYINPDSVDEPRSILGDRELFWINLLSTAYPLGLNDNIKGYGNISKSSFNNIYFKLKIKRYKRGHGRKRKNTSHELRNRKRHLSPNEIDDKFEFLNRIMSIDKYELFKSLNCLQNGELCQLSFHSLSRIGILYQVIQSFAKIHSTNPPPSNSPTINSEVITFHYSSKVFDKLKVDSVIKDSRILGLLPTPLQAHLPLKVYYKYDIPVGRKLFNYNKFLKCTRQRYGTMTVTSTKKAVGLNTF